MRHDMKRKLAPYAGVAYKRWCGGTSSHCRDKGSKVDDVHLLVVLRTWF